MAGLGSAMALAAAMPAAATGAELGDLFEYTLKDPITIEKNRSALAPIIQAGIGAEKVSIWNDRSGAARPQRALWLTNTSGLTLDGGSFSVMEDGSFAGEGLLDPLKPEEKRLVSFATDLAVNASSANSVEKERVTRVVIAKGQMVQESEVREKKTYTFRNADAAERVIVVEHPVRAGYQLRSQVKPEEATANWMRFRVPVAPKQTATLLVEEARTLSRTEQLGVLSANDVALYVRNGTINPAMEEAFRKILAQKDVISRLEDEADAKGEERTSIFDDQQRLRENIKALKGSAEEKALLQRYVQQLNEQESRISALGKETAQLNEKKAAEEAALDRMIQAVSFDVTL